MEEDDQQSENGLERRLNEMTLMVKEMRRQQTQMQTQMQLQAEAHENERKRWHEECQKVKEERDRLLKQGTQVTKPNITGLLMSSRVIGGSKASRSPSCLGNRPRNFHLLSDGFREKILEVVRQKREAFAASLQRQKQDLEADQTARALDALSISEQNKKPNPLPSPPISSELSSLEDHVKESFESHEHHFENFTKRRRMQQQLASVLHAQNCERNQVDSLGYMTCGMALCSITSKVLEHIRTCTFVTKCPTPMCSLTREVLGHYKNCTTDSCQICQLAKRESISNREHLLKFIDTIFEGLDEEVSVETPSVPNIVTPPVDSILYPHITRLSSLPTMIPGGALFPMTMEMPMFDLAPLPSINPVGGLFPQWSGSRFMPSILPLPSMATFMNRMETKTEETSTETKMEGSDAHE